MKLYAKKICYYKIWIRCNLASYKNGMEILNAPIIEKVYVYLRISGSSPQVVVFSLLLMIPDVEILQGIHLRALLDISQRQRIKEITDSPHNVTTCI